MVFGLRQIIAICLGLGLFPAQAQVLYSGQADPNALTNVPAKSVGADHSWYLDLLTGNVYGPKESGQWPPAPTTNLSTITDGRISLTALGAKCNGQVSYGFMEVDAPVSGFRRLLVNSAVPITPAAVGRLIQVGVLGNTAFQGTITAVSAPGAGPGGTTAVTTSNTNGTLVGSFTNSVIQWASDDTSIIQAALAQYQTILVPALCGISSEIDMTASGERLLGLIPPTYDSAQPTPFSPPPTSGFVWLGANGGIMFNQRTPNGAYGTRFQTVADLAFYAGNSASIGRNIGTVSFSRADNLYATDATLHNFSYGQNGATSSPEPIGTCNLVENLLLGNGTLFGGNAFYMSGQVAQNNDTCQSVFNGFTGTFSTGKALVLAFADHNNFNNFEAIGNGASTGTISVDMTGVDATHQSQANVFYALGVGNFTDKTKAVVNFGPNSYGNFVNQLDNYNPPVGWVPSYTSLGTFTCTFVTGNPCITTPPTLYVNASTGSDSYDGLFASVSGLHGPFATLTKACSAVRGYDQYGQSIYINVAAGSYAGCMLSGANRGAIGNNISGAYIVINGAGSGSTNITNNGSGFSIEVSNHAAVQIQNLNLQTPSGGYALFAQNFAVAQIGTGVKITGCGSTCEGIHTEAEALIEAAPNAITLAGTFSHIMTIGIGGYIELDPSPGGSFICSSCDFVNSFVFANGSGSKLLLGTGWSFSGFTTITGRPYVLNGDSTVNNASGITLPGTSLGEIATGGRMEPAPVSTASSTGLGTGGTTTVLAGTATGGTVKLTAGTAAASTGNLTITMPEYLLPNSNNTTVPAACTAALQDGTTGAWSTGAVKVKSNTFGSLVLTWSNSAALTSTQDYIVTYTCGG